MKLVGGLTVEKFDGVVMSQRCVEHDGELFYVSQNLNRGSLKTPKETIRCVKQFLKASVTRKKR